MFNVVGEIIRGIGKGVEQLLPRHDEQTVTWFAKLVTLFAMSSFIGVGSFMAIRNTPLGSQWGINSPEPLPMLSNKEYRDITSVLYTFLVRVKEEVPALRSAFVVAVFDENGDINYADENADTFGIFTWYTPNVRYFSFNAFESALALGGKQYEKALIDQKQCVTGPISGVTRQRLKEALPGFLSDHFVACPIPLDDARKPFAVLLAYWVSDPKRPEIENEMRVSAKNSADGIARYLRDREDLNLNR